MIENKLLQLINLPNTFVGEAPIGIDDCQWVRASAGHTDMHFDGGNYDKPRYSVYVRGIDNEETAKRTYAIHAKLRKTYDALGAIISSRLPSFVGRDQTQRCVYVFQIEYQTGGY